MSDMSEPIAFALPKKPRIKPKDAPPDQRKVCVLPIRAMTDQRLTDGAFRVLAMVCSYCNRAGITWVSQKRLAEEMQVSRQAITNQIASLRETGYIEIIRKGFRGERSNTLRVVFDPTITAEDAIAMTSNKEDTRPPAIKEEQERQAMQDMTPDPEGQRRIAQMIAKALQQPIKPKEYTMPKTGDTRAVREVKEAMAKAKAKQSKAVDNSQSIGQSTVSNESSPEVSNEALHRQSIGQPTVSHNTGEHSKRSIKTVKGKEDLNNLKTVMGNQEVEQLLTSGMTVQQVREAEELIAPLFAAEGITPSSAVMAQAIMQMHRDAA
jgi:DNA-binding transcriptional regulator LsrR (DeoR family)